MTAPPSRAVPALLTLALILGLSACDSADDTPSIGGTYRGSVAVEDLGTVAYRIVLPTVSSGPFMWSGDFTLNGTAPETVGGPGTYAYPAITLTDDGDTLAGTVSADGDRITFVDPESDLRLVVTR